MRRNVALAVLLAVCFLGASVAMADRSDFLRNEAAYAPSVAPGELYDRRDFEPRVRLVEMPIPEEPSSAVPLGGSVERGPLAPQAPAMLDVGSALQQGSAIVSPRGGGSIMTAEQRADRQLRQLIKRLN